DDQAKLWESRLPSITLLDARSCLLLQLLRCQLPFLALGCEFNECPMQSIPRRLVSSKSLMLWGPGSFWMHRRSETLSEPVHRSRQAHTNFCITPPPAKYQELNRKNS